jgi:hypothetical protein
MWTRNVVVGALKSKCFLCFWEPLGPWGFFNLWSGMSGIQGSKGTMEKPQKGTRIMDYAGGKGICYDIKFVYGVIKAFVFFFVVSLVAVHRSIIAVLFWPGEAKWSAVDWCLVLFCYLFEPRGYQLLLMLACVFSGGRIDYFMVKDRQAFIIILCSSRPSIFSRPRGRLELDTPHGNVPYIRVLRPNL